MPWKMIGFILILVLVALFASLNLTNRSDINLGFYVFKEVPIFLSLLIAFLAGAVITIPFTFRASARKKKAKKEKLEKKKKKKPAEAPKEFVVPEIPEEVENPVEPKP